MPRSGGLSLGAIQKAVSKAEVLALDWEAIEKLDDRHLAAKIYPQADTAKSSHKVLPDWVDIYRELKRKGMTKQLLWEEYTQQYPNKSFSYAQYCHLYRDWLKKQKRSMRQTHKAGEKLFVDYAGQTVPIVSHKTGEIRTAQIFVAVLGASNYWNICVKKIRLWFGNCLGLRGLLLKLSTRSMILKSVKSD